MVKRIVFILAFIAGSAAAQTVTVGTMAASCGGTTTVPVSIVGVSGMLSLEFRIAYDTALLTPGTVSAGTLTSGFSIASNATGGVLHVAMASGSPVSGSGTVANISFSIASSATGNASLGISDVLVNDVARSGVAGSVGITCVHAPAAPVLASPANGASGLTSPVTLQWNAVAEASAYRVLFGTSPNPGPFDTTSATSYMVTVQPGTTYFWAIQSINDAGVTASTIYTFSTAGTLCATPASPSLSAPAQANSGSPFDLTWNAVSDAAQYIVDESSFASFAGATSTAVTATHLSLTRTATADTPLYFRVHGRNSSGSCNVDGAFSNTAVVHIVPRAALAAGTRVFPVAGTIEGTLGSLFRTAVQLHNPTSAPISGRLIFHAQGVDGSSNDPALTYVLGPGEAVSYTDLVAAIGVAHSIGSVDLVPDGSTAPLSVVRIFNDAGPAGTTGMTVDSLDLRDAIQAGHRGILLAPINPNRARMNIGIRTLLDGVTVLVTVRDKHGATIQSSRWSYPATHFEQVSVMQFANAVLLGDEVITFSVESGSAIVYGTQTDNVTQDPSIQIARPVD